RDNGGHHDDRQQERDLRVSLRPGTDDRQLDRQQLHGGGGTARVERIHRARPRPHAHVVDHQHLRETHGRPGASPRGGSRVKLPVDRDTRRRWIDVAMGVAAFVCVIIAIIPLGSILLEASIRGLRSLSPALLTSTTGGGGIGNAIQGTLILILLSALVSLPRTILRVVVPSASSALVTGGLLGIARVAGETAPLLVTAFGSNDWFRGLDQPIESLPHTIYVWATGPYVAQNQAAWGVSLVLVVMMLGLSIVSRVVIRLRSVSR